MCAIPHSVVPTCPLLGWSRWGHYDSVAIGQVPIVPTVPMYPLGDVCSNRYSLREGRKTGRNWGNWGHLAKVPKASTDTPIDTWGHLMGPGLNRNRPHSRTSTGRGMGPTTGGRWRLAMTTEEGA